MAEDYIVVGKTQSGYEIKLPKAQITGSPNITKKPGSASIPQNGHTYTLNTGSKTYTLNQSQIDWMRQAHVNSWADAYAYDDDDQQRKAAGIAPRSYERNYKNTRLDNWLYENKLPSTKYLDKYLEAYDQYETERKEYEGKAKQKSDLYAAAAASSVDLELKGIYNDDKMYNWTDADGNDISMSGKDIHANAFFDALNSGRYGDFTDRYVFDGSDIEKTEADFETADAWREYQLKQSQKAFDLQKDWDDATSISYDDYLKNYKDAYDKQIKAQKIVGDEFGRTYGDAISDNERIRQSEAYGALTTRNAVDAFLESSQDEPADIIRNMYEYGVDQSLINRARKNLEKSARSDEDRDAIRDAYDSGNATGSIQNIFSSHLDGGRNYTAENATAARAEAKAAGYTDEQIDAAGKLYADARNRSYSGAWDREADDIVRYGSIEAADRVRAENTENKNERRDADKLLADVAEKYESGQIDLSTMSADEAANRILASLEYEGNYITSESIKSAIDGLLASGASYQVLKSATDKIIPMISRVNVVDNGERTVASSPITAKSIINDALDSARQADRTALAEAYRQSAMESGMSAYDVDQALRRAGFSDAISDAEAAKNYYIEVDLPRALESDSSWETVKAAYPDIIPEQYAADVWNQMTDEERAEYTEAFASSKLYNVDLHRTYGEQFATQFALIFPRVAAQIASGTVNLAEMIFSRQPDRWQVSKDLSELSAQFSMAGKSVGQDATSDVIAGAGDIASELVRMYTLSAAGTGLSSVFTKGASTASAASSKGLGVLVKRAFSAQSAPFLANAYGSYYAEAMEGGANRGQATVYALSAGTLEGMLEAMSVDNWINNRLGAATVKDMALGGKATLKSLDYGVKAVGLVSSAIGNALEEGTSYVASTLMKKALYDPSATIETDELSQQALMGGLIGLFGAAAQLPNQTYANSLYEYMSTHGYSTAAADALLSEIKYTEMSQDRREALTKKVSVSGTKALLSTEDYKAAVASIDQASLAVDGASRKLADTEAKAQADIAAKQGVVDRLTEQINGLPSASTGDVAMEQARLQGELATARDALNKQIEASRQAVDSSRKDLENVRLQSSRAIEKAQDTLDLHFVAMHNVLSPVMDRIVSASSTSEVESAANIAEALNDTMASVRAGEMPESSELADAEETPEEKRRRRIREEEQLFAKRRADAARIVSESGKSWRELVSSLPDLINNIGNGELSDDDYDYVMAVELLSSTSIVEEVCADIKRGLSPEELKQKSDAAIAEYEEIQRRKTYGTPHTTSEEIMLRVLYNAYSLYDSASNNPQKVLRMLEASTMESAALNAPSDTMTLTAPDLGANNASYVPQQAVSQFFTNTLDKMETDDGMRAVNDAAQALGLAGTYDIETEKHSMEMARQRLEVSFDDEVVDLRARNAWTGEDMDTAMGILAAYREQGMQSGDMNNYFEWLKVVSEHSTTAGQALQALAKYSRNTVDGMIVEAVRNAENSQKKITPNQRASIERQQEKVDKAVGEAESGNITGSKFADLLNNANGKAAPEILDLYGQYKSGEIDATTFRNRVENAIKKANGVTVVTSEDIAAITDFIKKGDDETDEYMKKVYYQKAAQIVADKSGSTTMEKLRTLRRVLMLLNPKTTVKNTAANLPMFGLETLKDVPGTLIDMLVSAKTGKRTTTAFSKDRYVESAKGFKKGAAEAAKDLKYGTQTSFLPGRYEGTRSHAFNGDTWLGNIMNRLDDATSGLMQLGDRMWAQAAFDGRLAELSSLGYDTSNPDVIRDAELYALDRVFQNNSSLAKRASQARNALGVFGEMVLPFTQTPANIMDKLLDYSPVGLGRALVQVGKEGKSGEFNQKLFVDRISRSLTGGGIMALGAALMRAGLLSLGASDQEEAEAMRLAGVQEYALKLGDSYVSIDWAEPAGSLMLIGAEIARQFGDDRIESEMDVFDSAVDATVTGLNVFFNNSFLSGVADLISGNQSVGEAIVDTVLGSASQYTSSGLSAIGRILDPYERYTYSPDWLASEARYLLSRFPGVRSTLDVKIGADGKPVKSTSGDTILARFVENMLVPYRSKKETNDATSKELYRLFAAGYDNALLPIAPKRLQGAELTADQRRDLQTAIGTDTYAAAEKVISSSAYKRATDAEREAMLDDAISNAESKAKKAWAKKNLG